MKSTRLFVLFLGLISATVQAQQEPKGQGTAFKSLPVLRSDDQLRYLLPMTVESKETHFLIDAGCGYSTVVSLDLAKSLKKELGEPSEMTGIGGDSESYEVEFDQFKIGGSYAVKFKQTHVTDLARLRASNVDGKPVKPEGLVGSQTLMALRGVLDTAAGRILVPPSDSPKGIYLGSMKKKGAVIIPMSKKKYAAPYINVTLKGKTYVFLIDTGATANLIEPEVAKELELEITGTSAPVVGKGAGVADQAPRVKATDLLLGDAVQVPELGFTVLRSRGFKEEGQTYGGIIGVPVLNALKAQLDFDTYSLIVPRN